MKRRFFLPFLVLSLFFLLSPGAAVAASLMPDPSVSLSLPDGWETADPALPSADPELTRLFDCAEGNPSQRKALGWKTGADGKITAAFCVSYQQSGIGKMRALLKASAGKQREAIAAKFLDSFAATLKSEYELKRKMTVPDISADLLEAGEDFVLVMDGKISGNALTLFHASTVYLHADALLKISFVYKDSTPPAIVQQLDAIPLSVQWK